MSNYEFDQTFFSWYKDSDGTAATDMSVSQHTQWVKWKEGARSAMIACGNTATGSPVGTREVRVSGHGDLSVTTSSPYDGASPSPVAGAAMDDILIIDNPVKFIQLSYTATSGGTGAKQTDDTRIAGRRAYIFFFGG